MKNQIKWPNSIKKKMIIPLEFHQIDFDWVSCAFKSFNGMVKFNIKCISINKVKLSILRSNIIWYQKCITRIFKICQMPFAAYHMLFKLTMSGPFFKLLQICGWYFFIFVIKLHFLRFLSFFNLFWKYFWKKSFNAFFRSQKP